MLVFKVFSLNSVQQFCFLLQNAFLSRLWSRSLIFPVEAFKIFAQDTVHPLLRTFQLVFLVTQMNLGKGVFALFTKIKKCETGSAFESESARQCQLIHASSSSPYSSLGAGHDPHGSGALLLGPPHGADTLANGGRIRALPGGCGLMAAMCVLGMVRSSRRLTACDVVVGTFPCDQA